jgi:hypothetical protein
MTRDEPGQLSMLRVTQRDRERIGGIRSQTALHFEQRSHHVRHLQLVGTTEPYGREFDRPRRVLGNLVFTERGQGCTARLPELERTVDVAIDENFFDGYFSG